MKTTNQTCHRNSNGTLETVSRPTSRLRARMAGALAAIAIIMTATVASVTSCDVMKQVAGTYNMVNCRYEYRSLADVSVAGINVSRGLSLLDAPKILGLLSGGVQSLPVTCTVNLDVQNPGTTEALMSGMEYTGHRRGSLHLRCAGTAANHCPGRVRSVAVSHDVRRCRAT